MPRVRAHDYDDKAQAIMDNAASMFASVGYANAKLQDVAKACGATKSMLYHYFPTKDDLLSALLTEHLERLIADVEQVAESNEAPDTKILNLVSTYVQKSAASRQRHVSAMNDVKYLSKGKQGAIVALEREVIAAAATILSEVRPDLSDVLIKTYTMLLLGTLNWTDLWLDPHGRLSANEICQRIADLFLDGFTKAAG